MLFLLTLLVIMVAVLFLIGDALKAQKDPMAEVVVIATVVVIMLTLVFSVWYIKVRAAEQTAQTTQVAKGPHPSSVF